MSRLIRTASSAVALGALAVTLVACGTDEPTDVADAQDDQDTDQGEAAASDDPDDGPAETIELNIGSATLGSTIEGVGAVEDDFIPTLVERVSAETNYELDVNEFFGTLVGVGEELEAIQAGQLDIGTQIFPYNASELPLHNLAYYVPFSSVDLEVTIPAYRSAYEEISEFNEIYPQYNQQPLAFFAAGDYGLITTEPWDGVEDLSGRSIAGVGANLEWMRGLGVNPIAAPAAEWYTSFQTGVFDGAIMYLDGITGLNLPEVADYFTDMQFGSVPVGSVNVNLDTWESLPDEVRVVIEDVASEWETRTAIRIRETVEDAMDVMDAEGMTVRSGDEFREAWAQAVAELPGERAREMDAEGLPGTEAIEAYIQAQIELGHEFPVEYDLAE